MLRLPLRIRIVITTCATSILCAAVLSYFHYRSDTRAALAQQIASMGEAARLLASDYRARHDHIADDMVMLAASPTIRALVHANLIGAPTELYGLPPSSAPLQTARDFFASLLASRPDYVRFSLVSREYNGREILRVSRLGGKVTSIPTGRLQSHDVADTLPDAYEIDGKGVAHPRPGSSHLLFLNPGSNPGPGDAARHLSKPMTVTYPIVREGQGPIGFIVATADMQAIVASTFEGIKSEETAYLQTPSGLYHRSATCGACLISKPKLMPSVAAVFRKVEASPTDEGSISGPHTISYFVRTKSSDETPSKDSILVLQDSRDRILQAAASTARKSLLIILSAVVLLGAATAWLTGYLLRPLKLLEAAVVKARSNEGVPQFPISSTHEVGNVARAFQDLVEDYAEAEIRLAAVIDNIGEGILTYDGNGNILTYNPACERIFQWRADEMIGKSVAMLMPEEMAKAHSIFLAWFRKRKCADARLHDHVGTGLRKDGSTFPLELTVSDIDIDDSKLLIGIVRDITERRAAEQAKSEFVATISHELRTPLTSIHGALGLIGTDAISTAPEKVRHLAGVAFQNSKRLINLVDNLLDLGKLTSADLPVRRKPTNLRPVVLNAVAAFEGVCREAQVDLKFADTGADATVLIDAERIVQVIGSLLSNAAKFSGPGTNVKIRIERVRDEGKVRVLVEDEGCGIPEEAQETVFDRFTQADSSDRRKFEGTGLGLFIARKIIEMHGGTIGLQSEVGVGTTIHFDLDVVERSDKEPHVDENPDAETATPSRI